MFQVTVPGWGSSTKKPTFEVVQTPSKPDGDASKKRIRDTTADDAKATKSAPDAKKPKLTESSTPYKASTPTQKKQEPQDNKNKAPKAAGNSGKPSTANSGLASPAASKPSTSTQPKRNDTPKKTGKGPQIDGTGLKATGQAPKPKVSSSAPQSKKPEPSPKAKKAGKGKKGKNDKKRHGNDSDADSIDELFGSYGASDSELSFTSDEGSMSGIIIKSPTQSRNESGDDAGSLDSSIEVTTRRDDFSSDGFSSESDSEKRSSKSKASLSKKRGKMAVDGEGSEESDGEDSRSRRAAPLPSNAMSSLQQQMKASLEGGRFRFINEKLYTSEGKEAFTLFQKQPELFDFYHQGYRNQVEKWPENPLDIIISWIKKQPSTTIVADFGCGEARLADEVTKHRAQLDKKLKRGKNGAINVFSFDLVARNKYITASDIARVPLENASVDVAVFCLSLMGTNVVQFLKEAYRVLRPGGILKIAEVKSRFEKISDFLESLKLAGFDVSKKDETNKMFVLFDCTKSDRKPSRNTITLKPCIYKRR